MNHKHKFELELDECKTLKEVFNVCEKFYDCNHAELSTVSRSMVKGGIKTAISIINPKERIL